MLSKNIKTMTQPNALVKLAKLADVIVFIIISSKFSQVGVKLKQNPSIPT